MARPARLRGAARPRVLLVAPHSSYRIPAYVRAARALGGELLIASKSRYSLVGELAAGMYVDLGDPDAACEALTAEARRRPIEAVVGSDDVTVEIASRVAERLGLAHNPPAAARLARRKDLARARLAEAGLPVPEHRRLDLERDPRPQLAGLRYPVVLKPLALAASRGVIRANDSEELAAACGRIHAILAAEPLLGVGERRYALAEAYIPGREVALEGLLEDGRLRRLALFDKPDPLEGPYFEETYYVTPSRLEADPQARVEQRVAEACAAYGLAHGPVHAELRVDGREAWVLEIAARTIGGHCGRLLRFGTGYGLEELVLAQALGRAVDPAGEGEAAGVLMIPVPRRGVLRRVEGVAAARRVPHVEDLEITVREGYELVPPPEGDQYLGFVFAKAPTPAAAEAALREAHACLNVVTAPVFRVVASARRAG